MNILVIGPGDETGKFGRDFCDLAQAAGHTVRTISHLSAYRKVIGYDKSVTADFSDFNSMSNAFDKATFGLDHLDMMLYNSKYSGRINDRTVKLFTEKTVIPVKEYTDALQVQVICPHFFTIKTLSKMSAGSRIIFMTTGLTYSLDPDNTNKGEYAYLVGYAGSKSFQNMLMLGLAYHNDKGIIATSVSPHFPYEDTEKYQKTLTNTYNRIMLVNEADNGTLIRIGKI